MSIGSFIYYKHTYEESVIYDASSDIIQIFINNSDDFDEFVSKFYGHHLWSDYYNDTYDKDFCHDKEFKKYLTDEEYSYIECFNDKYHPAFWGSYHFGFYWDEISSTVEYMLEPEKRISKNEEKNYVELIQEWSLKRYNELPDIHSDNSNYYDETSLLHYANEIRSVPKRDPNVHIINVQEYPKTHFVSKLRLRGIDKLFVGYGSSKNAARKDACELAYHYLDNNNLLFSIQDEIENPSRDRAINQLETLARRGYFSIPTYKFEQEYDNNGNPVWKCECYIEKVKYYYFSTSSSKKEAKKSAAFDMLLYVLGYEKED